MELVKNLYDVKVGDKFCMDTYSWRGSFEEVKCTKVTATRAIIGGRTFTKADAREYGGGRYAHYDLYRLDDEARKVLHEQELKAWAADHRFSNLTTDQIEQMMAIERGERVAEKQPQPNTTTLAAMQEIADGGGERFESPEALFQSWEDR